MSVIRSAQKKTVGVRLFGCCWCSIMEPDIVTCDTLSQFHRELITFLFRQSYPSILFQFFLAVLVVFIRPHEKFLM